MEHTQYYEEKGVRRSDSVGRKNATVTELTLKLK